MDVEPIHRRGRGSRRVGHPLIEILEVDRLLARRRLADPLLVAVVRERGHLVRSQPPPVRRPLQLPHPLLPLLRLRRPAPRRTPTRGSTAPSSPPPPRAR